MTRELAREDYGPKALFKLMKNMICAEIDGEKQHVFLFGNDEDALFIARKIVRGLACEHFGDVISDERVTCQISKRDLPAEFERDLKTIHPDVFSYAFVDGAEFAHSLWFMRIYNRVELIGTVAA